MESALPAYPLTALGKIACAFYTAFTAKGVGTRWRSVEQVRGEGADGATRYASAFGR